MGRKFQTFRLSDRTPPVTDYFSEDILLPTDAEPSNRTRQVFEVNLSTIPSLFRRFSPGIVGIYFSALSVHFSHKHGLFDGLETNELVRLKHGVWLEARQLLLAGQLLRHYRKRLVPQDGYYVRAKRLDGDEWQKLRRQVFQRDKNRCQYCGDTSLDPHCDHVIPLAHGGNNQLHNLATACPPCNLAKSDTLPESAK